MSLPAHHVTELITPVKPGLVHAPTTPQVTAELQRLLVLDQTAHHVFLNPLGFHDHLSHHLVAAYDFGAPIELLKLIYDNEEKTLLAINPNGVEINEKNWTEHLGEPKFYGSYFAFFLAEIKAKGVPAAFHKYVMAPDANGNGARMFSRLWGGILHPFLQIGFGVEFGQDYMVAAGMTWAAVEDKEAEVVFDGASELPELSTSTKAGVTLLSLLREVYDTPALKPSPYVPVTKIPEYKLIEEEHAAAIQRIYAQWPIDTTLNGSASDAEFSSKVEECFIASTLLFAATSRPNHAPRADFFLMHLLTSSLCLPSLLKIIPKPEQKAQLLQGYVRVCAMQMSLRGRPRIDIPLLMSYSEYPAPPATVPVPHENKHTLGDTRSAAHGNPWLAIIHNALQHKDTHLIKTVRALYYASQVYGAKRAGEVTGVVDEKGKEETHRGVRELDGSMFIRAAGMVTDALGWVAFGEEERKWDFSGVGWDDAWA